jgi:hypothetical protein
MALRVRGPSRVGGRVVGVVKAALVWSDPGRLFGGSGWCLKALDIRRQNTTTTAGK